MKIEIWSDFVCPFCYVGKKMLEAALVQFPFHDEVELEYKSFSLHLNTASIETGASIIKRAKKLGLRLSLNKCAPANTLDAHRLLKYAKTKQIDQTLIETFMKAYFIDRLALDSPSILTQLAVEAGLPEAEVRAILATHEFDQDVHDDETEASCLGVQSVPFFVFNRKYAITDIQSMYALKEAIRDVWNEENPHRKWVSKQGKVCFGDECMEYRE